MRIRKNGSALISSIIVLSVISLLASMYYKMTIYNIQLGNLNYNHNDRYNLSKEENDIIYEYMKKINLKDNEEGISMEKLKEKSFVGKNSIWYDSNIDKFIFAYYRDNYSKNCTEINYKIDNNKIILIPSHVVSKENFELIK